MNPIPDKHYRCPCCAGSGYIFNGNSVDQQLQNERERTQAVIVALTSIVRAFLDLHDGKVTQNVIDRAKSILALSEGKL